MEKNIDIIEHDVNDDESVEIKTYQQQVESKKQHIASSSNQVLKRVKTRGEGNCAFHAIFGAWDPIQREYICQDVPAKRAQLAQAIKASKKGEIFFTLTQAVIQHLVEEPEVHANIGPRIRATREFYNQFKENYNREKQTKLQYLEAAILNNHDLYEDVLRLSNYCSNDTLKIKFDRFRAERENDFQEYLNKDDNLKQVVEGYDAHSKKAFDWNSKIDVETINEYVECFISKDCTHLLPLEVEMVAYAFDITINYYNLTNNKIIYLNTYNPKGNNPNTVSICFNGINHFERIINQNEILQISTSFGSCNYQIYSYSKPRKTSHPILEINNEKKFSDEQIHKIKKSNPNKFNKPYSSHEYDKLNERLKLILQKLNKLINYVNNKQIILSTKLNDNNKDNNALSALFKKRLTKIKNSVEKLHARASLVNASTISLKPSNELAEIQLLVEKFIRNIKNDICQKNSHIKHFEFLQGSAKETCLEELALLRNYSNWSYPLLGEAKIDENVRKQSKQLRREQKQAEQLEQFQQALNLIRKLGKNHEAKISCFICYAYPSKDRPWENFTHKFLTLFRKHLESAGITVWMDLTDSQTGFSSNTHMDRIITTSKKVILIGTESLLDKFRLGVSSVCYELNLIHQRRRRDESRGLYNVLPMIISGTIETALPAQYERFIVTKQCEGDYVGTFKDIVAQLYDFGSEHAEYNACWKQMKIQPTISLYNKVNLAEKNEDAEKNVKPNNKRFNHKTPYILPGLLNKLKNIYKDKAFSGVQRLFDDEVMSIENYYVNLVLIKEEEQKRKEDDQKRKNEYAENELSNQQKQNILNLDESTELFNSAEHSPSVQEPIELKNIFDQAERDTSKQRGPKTNRMLIIGRAGIGKTTVCQYIVNQWAQDKLWSERYQGVFRIPLRNLIASRYTAERNYSLLEIINRECFANRLTEEEQKQLDMEFKIHREMYLIILDGYDELSMQKEDEYLVRQIDDLMNYPQIIVTSRPQQIRFAADKKLEILGFTEKNINNYVTNFFNQDEAQRERLFQQLQTHPVLRSLAHIPINLELICSAWQRNNWSEKITLTELYQHLVGCLQYRYLKKFHPIYSNPEQLQKLADLSQEEKKKLCAQWLDPLEFIAWQMLQRGIIYINKNELFQNETELRKKELMLKQLRESGLLRLSVDRQFYYFSHLTFQEFFAACYAAKIIQNAGLRTNAEYEAFQIFFKENKFNPKRQFVWWFVSGLLTSHEKALKKYFNLLFSHPSDLLVIQEISILTNSLEQVRFCEDEQFVCKVADKLKKIILEVIKNDMKNNNGLSEKLLLKIKNCYNFLKKYNIEDYIINETKELQLDSRFNKDNIINWLKSQQVNFSYAGENTNNLANIKNEDIYHNKSITISNKKKVVDSLIVNIEKHTREEKLDYIYEITKIIKECNKNTINELIHSLGNFVDHITNFNYKLYLDLLEEILKYGDKEQINEIFSLYDKIFQVKNVEISVKNEFLFKFLISGFFTSCMKNYLSKFLNNLLETLSSKDIKLIHKAIKYIDNKVLTDYLRNLDSNKILDLIDSLVYMRKSHYLCNITEIIIDKVDPNTKSKIIDKLKRYAVRDSYKYKAAHASLGVGKIASIILLQWTFGKLLNSTGNGTSQETRAESKDKGRVINILTGKTSEVLSNYFLRNHYLASKNALTALAALLKAHNVSDNYNDYLDILKNSICWRPKESEKDHAKFAEYINHDIIRYAYTFIEYCSDDNLEKTFELIHTFDNISVKPHFQSIFLVFRTDFQENLKSILELGYAADSSIRNFSKESIRKLFNFFKKMTKDNFDKYNKIITTILKTILKNDSLYKFFLKDILEIIKSKYSAKIDINDILKVFLKTCIKENYAIAIYFSNDFVSSSKLVLYAYNSRYEKYTIELDSNMVVSIKDFAHKYLGASLMQAEESQINFNAFFNDENIDEIIRFITLCEYDAGVLNGVMIALNNNIESSVNITPLLFPQTFYNKSNVMQAISQGVFSQILTVLSNNSTILNISNAQSKTPASYVFESNLLKVFKIQKFVLRYRPYVSLDHLNQVLENDFLLHYEDKRGTKDQDLQLVEKVVTQLIGIGISNVNAKIYQDRERVLAYALNLHLDKYKYKTKGLFADDYLLFRLAYYLQLLGKITNDTIHNNHYPQGPDKKSLSKPELIALIKCELLLIWEALRLHDEWQCISYPSQNYSSEQIEELWEAHALSIIDKLKELSPGEELIYPTGYEGHCIYVVFTRCINNIIGRVDNLLEADIKNMHQSYDKEYKPYFLGEWQINEDLGKSNCSFKNYLMNHLFLAKTQERNSALPLIYLSTPQNHNILKDWPALPPQGTDNCVVKGFQLGMLCRSGSEDVFKFLEEEHAKLWVSAIINPMPLNNFSSPSAPVSTYSNSQRATGLNFEVKKEETTLRHRELMQHLAKELNIPYDEVLAGSTVEQTLVDATGIQVKQINPEFRRNKQNNDPSTMFYLNFPDKAVKETFIIFYQNKFPGIILRVIEEDKTRIDFDTNLFVEEIIPLLKLYREKTLTEFITAVKSEDIDKLNQMNLELYLQARDDNGDTALHISVENNLEAVTKLLLTCSKVEINSIGALQRTPLHIACANGLLAMVKLLLAKGADKAAQQWDGASPLHCAAWYGYADIVKLLLDNKANIEARATKGDFVGWTPLHSAASRGHRDVVKLLLGNGANIKALDAKERTPLDIAQLYKQTEVIKLLSEALSVQNYSAANISQRFFVSTTHSQASNNDKNESYRCLIM